MDLRVTYVGDLDRAIFNRDANAMRDILTRNPELLTSHPLRHLPMYRAVVLSNNQEILEILIEFGADVNLQNPLKIALLMGDLNTIEILLRNGAKLDWGDDVSPVTAVVTKFPGEEKEPILQLLLRYNLKTEGLLDEFVAHIKGTEIDPVNFAETLLFLGMSLNDVDRNGLLPFHYAIEEENLGLVTFLIRHGADVNKKTGNDPKDYLPLLLAARGKSVEIVKKLVYRGAKIDVFDHDGWTALHHACCYNRDQIISFLITKGADICAKTKKDKTPFELLYFKPDDNLNKCVNLMVKEFAILSVETKPIPEKDWSLMISKPELKGEYKKCRNEVCKMLNHKIDESHRYYDVLKMSQDIKKLSVLAKNEEFVKKFEEKLSEFPSYAIDLRRVMDEAIQYQDE